MRPQTALWPVLLVNFIGTLGLSIVLPFLVFLITRLGGNAQVYGLVGATYPLFQFVGAPVLGRWSDRFGRRRILLLSQAGTLAAWLVFAVALFLPVQPLAQVQAPLLGEFTLTLPLLVIFASRALDGLTGGNISVANAYVADVSTDATRARNFGRMGVASNAGLILGPALASLLGLTPWGEMATVFAAIAISLAATVLIAALLPESQPCAIPPDPNQAQAHTALGQEPRDCVRAAETSPLSTVQVLRRPRVGFMLLLYFVIFLAFSFFYTAFPAHAVQNLSWTVVDTGIFFSVLSAVMVLVQGPVLATLSRRVREPLLVVAGCAILGANFLLLLSPSTALVYGAAVLFSLGNGIMWPSVVSLVSQVAGGRLQGAVQGLAGSAGSLASIGGLILGGVAFGLLGPGTFVISAGLAFLAALMGLRLLRWPVSDTPEVAGGR